MPSKSAAAVLATSAAAVLIEERAGMPLEAAGDDDEAAEVADPQHHKDGGQLLDRVRLCVHRHDWHDKEDREANDRREVPHDRIEVAQHLYGRKLTDPHESLHLEVGRSKAVSSKVVSSKVVR